MDPELHSALALSETSGIKDNDGTMLVMTTCDRIRFDMSRVETRSFVRIE